MSLMNDREHEAVVAEQRAKAEQERVKELAESMVSIDEYDGLVDDYNSLVRKYNNLGEKRIQESRVTGLKQLLGYLFLVVLIAVLLLTTPPTFELLKAVGGIMAFAVVFLIATLTPEKYDPFRWLAIHLLDFFD